MRILVLAENYPDLKGNKALMYIHTRNIYYKKRNIEVKVINFRCEKSYSIDGIDVYSEKDYRKLKKKKFDIVACHAPNIKNHYRFLKSHRKNLKQIVLIFHGHEVLRINEVYPKPYDYLTKESKVINIIQNSYDILKIFIWRRYIERNIKKINLIFVSNQLYKEFLYFTKINKNIIQNKVSIIYNSVALKFEKNKYSIESSKDYDFVTIRSNIDSSTYCIDLVNKIASKNKKFKFLIIGQGKYFEINKKSNNITFVNKNLDHDEIIDMINRSRYALMLTRRDTQGVMSCEMATFGIPLITSNISICKEIFNGFKNVYLIDNKKSDVELDKIIKKENLSLMAENHKYYEENTVKKEIDLFLHIIKGNQS